MPRSAKAGHLVTKVTAVDADSGHNAWISYRLAEATDASLFSVNLHTGEVRTKRSVSEQDDSSQRLLIEITDNGEPVQSSTVTVDVLIEDGFHEPVSDYRRKSTEISRKSGKITLYLIISLASVSLLCLLTFFILLVKCARGSRGSSSCCIRRSESGYKNPNRNLQIQLNTDGPIKYVEVLGGDMMSQSQSFGSYLSPMSEFSDFTLVKPSSTTDFTDTLNVLDASLPDSTWKFESQQRMPRSAKAGHLVTKVTAVDADSGHNAWISYRLAEATDASLFSVNLHTGEVRTKRSVSEQDDSSQRLLIEIKDNGEPVQSSTVTVDVLIEDGFHEPVSDYRRKSTEISRKSGKITLYLIISLASVSLLCLMTFFILLVKCARGSRGSSSCCIRRSESGYKNPNRNLQIQLNTDGPIKYVEVLGGDMMSQSQSFGSYLSPMSEFSDFTLVKPSSTTDFTDTLNVLDASLPDSTWKFESQQRMPRSAKAGHLVTKVTAVDADSGHNAWISYRLAEATDASLFSVNLHTGEVRTKRSVSEQDDSSQRLLIEIKDNGEPVQSSTVTVDVLIEDGFHEPVSDYRRKSTEISRKSGKITLYLIISLASVSLLCLMTFFILLVKCARGSSGSSSCCIRRSESGYKNPNRNLQIQLNTDGPIKYVEVLGGDMMSQSQSFGSYLSPMSEFSDFTLVKPSSTTDFTDTLNVLDASLPDSTWKFESQQVGVY
ncbi:hypothetical protein AOLI_G00231600 [Acnodon oligacanthus]